MMHPRTTTAAAILGLLLTAVAVPRCSADIDFTGTNSLKGLAGVQVVVQDLTPAVKKAGLSQAQILTDAELRLRQSGIRVLTHAACLKTPGIPWLLVSIFAIPHGTWLTYSVEVNLHQAVELLRGPGKFLFAITWSTGHMGTDQADGVRQVVRDQVDDFANDFLSVNPKK